MKKLFDMLFARSISKKIDRILVENPNSIVFPTTSIQDWLNELTRLNSIDNGRDIKQVGTIIPTNSEQIYYIVIESKIQDKL